MAYAIDRQKVSEVGEYGYEPASNQTGIVTPTFSSWLDPGLAKQYTYNPQKAIQTLEAAGYKRSGGIFHTPDGKPLSFRIINIGGPDGQSGSPYRAHNVTCKAGLIGLVKAITIEFAHAGITANVVVPGMMDTTRSPVDYPGWPPSQHTIANRVPSARLGQSDEVAFACRFLASNAAGYISGQTLHVNGGQYMP